MSKSFKIKSNFGPAGDQPQAIQKISKGLKSGLLNQTLKGVTGSGKTFAMANVIENLQIFNNICHSKSFTRSSNAF